MRQKEQTARTHRAAGNADKNLQAVLARRDVWTGRQAPSDLAAGISTGWPGLDRKLLTGGWPRSELLEICHGRPGYSGSRATSGQNGSSGAINSLSCWSLLQPALKSLPAPQYAFVLNPPLEPYLPGMAQQGIDTHRLMVVRVSSPDDWVASWCDILTSDCCGLLLAWPPAGRLRYAQLRKLQLAASRSSALTFLLRDSSVLKSHTPAALRLLVQADVQALQVKIERQRGTYRLGQVELAWPDYLKPGRLDALPFRSPEKPPESADLLNFPGRPA